MNEPRIDHVLMLAAGVMVLLLVSGTAEAACGGSSPNRIAASASRADVNDCVTAAISGDTITVPTGTATWSTPIVLPSTKDLDIIGATVVTCTGSPVTCTFTASPGGTQITCGICFTINLAASHRISGFNMVAANSGGIGLDGEQASGKHFRIDHNRIAATVGWSPMELPGGNFGAHPQGIIDNNLIVDVAIHPQGTNCQLDDPCADAQHIIWAQQTPLGDSVNIVYIEGNEFRGTSGNVNNSDSNLGGRYVYRFNNVTGGRHTSEVHGPQNQGGSTNRGSQRTEIYNNNMTTGLVGFTGTTFFRGGAGVIFGNRQASTYSFGILFDVDRVADMVPTCGLCNGASACDQNTAGQSGWRCRDQVSISHDSTQWDHSPIGAYAQVTQPIYMWDNLTAGSPMAVDAQVGTTWIQANREYYNEVTPFTGTTGVGRGPIASRPATCTTGVAYWATDEGEWNSLQVGADGRLYKCTATNTWTLYYTPYPYPHPWTLQGDTTIPRAPSNLQVQ